MAPAISVSVVAQWLSIRHGWFYLDDVRNLAEARREGLGWALLTDPVAEHLVPGRRLLDWLVAVPLGRSWAAAGVIVIAWAIAGLVYLGLTLEVMYGRRRRMVVPVLLAGTSVPLLLTQQWFAAAAHVAPLIACTGGALYHHLRWRRGDPIRHGAIALCWTAAGFSFSIQAFVIPAFLAVAVLVMLDRPIDPRLVRREALMVAPMALLGVCAFAAANILADPAESRSVRPALWPDLADVVRVITGTATRSVIPAWAGVGLDGTAGPTAREAVMVAAAAAVLVAGVAAGWWIGHRWCAALVLLGVGVVVTGTFNAVGRLSLIRPDEIVTTPRYQLPAVLMGSLALGALLTPRQATRPGPRPRWTRPAVALAVPLAALVYSANLVATYRDRRVALDFGTAAWSMTRTVEASLAQLGAEDRAPALVDGPLPFPLWYVDPVPSDRLHEWGHFFDAGGVVTPGVPAADGHRYRISPVTGLVERLPR